MRSNAIRATGGGHQEQTAGLDRDCLLHPRPGTTGARHSPVSLARGDDLAGRAGRNGRHAVDYRHLWNGGLLGQQAAEGVGNSHGPWRARTEVLRAALGRAFKLLAFGSAADWSLGIIATQVLASIVYQANPRDPLVLAGVVLAMALLGMLATWIPAQRALSVNPLTLLREE